MLNVKRFGLGIGLMLLLTACGGGGGSGSSQNTSGVDIPPSDSIRSGRNFALMFDENGTLYSAGTNDVGQLSRTSTSRISSTFKPVENLASAQKIEAGDAHAVIIDDSGNAFSFGDNTYGQLGTLDINDSAVPVQIHGIPPIHQAAAGMGFSLLLGNDGAVYGLGDNRYDQLAYGQSDRNRNAIAKKIDFDKKIHAVFASGFSAALVDENGSVYFLGYGGWGISGFTNFPHPVPNLQHIVSVSFGSSFALYLDKDGNVYAAGNSKDGRLGLQGVETDSDHIVSTPTKIASLPPIAMIAAGNNWALFLDREGNVWGTGSNADGNLGFDDNQTRTIPEKVPGLSGITAIASGSYSAYALKNDGKVLSWGYGGYGSLGHEDLDPVTQPKQISGFTGIH